MTKAELLAYIDGVRKDARRRLDTDAPLWSDISWVKIIEVVRCEVENLKDPVDNVRTFPTERTAAKAA